MGHLKKINMLNCKIGNTPMNFNEKLSLDDEVEIEIATFSKSIVGGINRLSHTRLNMTFCRSCVYVYAKSKKASPWSYKENPSIYYRLYRPWNLILKGFKF